MHRLLLSAASLSLALMLGGCQLLETLPFGRGGRLVLAPHVMLTTQPLMYQGDLLRFETTASSPLVGTARLTLINRSSEESKVLEVPASTLDTFTLKLEADALPGYAETALNRYHVVIQTEDSTGRSMESGGEVWVVSDRGIQAPPKRRLANGIGYPEVWNTGKLDDLETFAFAIAQEDWMGQELTLRRRELQADERPSMPRIPSDAVLWEFVASGDFPRYALPAELSGTGSATLMTPSTLKIVLSLSEPSYVIRVTADEETR